MSLISRCVVAGVVSLALMQASVDEHAIVRAVDAGNGDALALLERIVNINSGTQNLEGVRKVGPSSALNSTRSDSKRAGSTAPPGTARGTSSQRILRPVDRRFC